MHQQSDIDLSVDDRFLYVSCWGTGELKQYDVSDPAHPIEVGSVRLGGIVGQVAHPAAPDLPLAGGPQMVEVSRDGKRVYFTNSLYGAWDDQFPGWCRCLDGQTRRRSRRWTQHRQAVLPARGRLSRAAAAPGPPPGRRRLLGLVLLSLRPRSSVQSLSVVEDNAAFVATSQVIDVLPGDGLFARLELSDRHDLPRLKSLPRQARGPSHLAHNPMEYADEWWRFDESTIRSG